MRDAMTRERGSVETTGRRMDAVRRRRGDATERASRRTRRNARLFARTRVRGARTNETDECNDVYSYVGFVSDDAESRDETNRG